MALTTASALQNPLLQKLQTTDPWGAANSLKVGASPGTCGKKSELYDKRPYGVALSQTSYPSLAQLFQGAWNTETQQDCLQLFRDAADRGSYPIAVVGLLSLQVHLQNVKEEVWRLLDADRQIRIARMIQLAQGDPDFVHLFPLAKQS